jgi:hypothetical protein
VTAPLLAGAVSSASGPRTAFLVIAVIAFAGALALASRARNQRPTEVVEDAVAPEQVPAEVTV